MVLHITFCDISCGPTMQICKKYCWSCDVMRNVITIENNVLFESGDKDICKMISDSYTTKLKIHNFSCLIEGVNTYDLMRYSGWINSDRFTPIVVLDDYLWEHPVVIIKQCDDDTQFTGVQMHWYAKAIALAHSRVHPQYKDWGAGIGGADLCARTSKRCVEQYGR